MSREFNRVISSAQKSEQVGVRGLDSVGSEQAFEVGRGPGHKSSHILYPKNHQ